MRRMTQADLEAAFAGESQAYMKYVVFSDKAAREGLPNIARLFKAIAYAEQIHATSHFKTLKGVGKTADNLAAAIDGETYEVEEMYPAFIEVAKLQNERAAARSSTWALEAEKIHAGMYSSAKTAVDAGNDAEVGQVYVCSVCGWTGEGEPPDQCPLCKVKKEKFVVF